MKKVVISEEKVKQNFWELAEWLKYHIGEGLPFEYFIYPKQTKLKKFMMHSSRWCHINEEESCFYFKDNSAAVLFKLAWGGE